MRAAVYWWRGNLFGPDNMPCTEAAGRSAFTLLRRLQSPVAMKFAFIVQVSYFRPDDGFSLQKCLLPDSCCCTFLKGTTAYTYFYITVRIVGEI